MRSKGIYMGIRNIAIIVSLTIPAVTVFSIDVTGHRTTDWHVSEGILEMSHNLFRIYNIDGAYSDPVITYALGTFTQSGNSITLNYTFTLDREDGYNLEPSTEVKILTIRITDNLFSGYELVNAEGNVWATIRFGLLPQNGTRKIFENRVVYAYNSTAVVNVNARLRKGPSQQYDFYTLTFWGDTSFGRGTPRVYTSVQQGTEITIFAHSENTEIINGVEAYWYYIKINEMIETKGIGGWWPVQDFYYGWIWGALIDFD